MDEGDEEAALEALEAHGDGFYPTLEAADVLPLSTYCYPSADPRLQDIDGEPVFSLYVVDIRRYPEWHQEHALGTEFDGDWILNEENVQKVYSEPKLSLRQRLFRSR